VLFVSQFSKHSLYDVLPFLHANDPGYLEELFNSSREATLAGTLGEKPFRGAQIKRIRLALEWLKRRAANAGYFQQWAYAEAKKTEVTYDLEVRAAAEELAAACSEYRMAAGIIRRQLQRWLLQLILLPLTRVPHIAPLKKIDSFDLLQSYEKLEEAAVRLAQACGGDYYDLLADAL
jgi:hypothetical protein